LNKILIGASASPVHINCRFREPLAPETTPYKYDELKAQLDPRRRIDTPPLPPDTDDVDKAIATAASILSQKEKGLIVIGPEVPFRSIPDISALSRKLKWPIVADILSQKRHGGEEYIIDHYDLFLDVDIISDNLEPDVVLHFGGLPTSKRLNQFLARNKGIDYVKIQDHEHTIDPDHLETMRIICNGEKFIDKIKNQIVDQNDGNYFGIWKEINSRTAGLLANYFNHDRLTEISLAYWLGKALEDNQALFLSSSMPVRDADAFIPAEKKDIIIGANRGVSGIDGVIASACGFAEGCRRPTFLLIGDLAFIHDLNSLSLAKQSKVPIVLLVVNNNGGGIFHFLPIARHTDHFEEYFAAPHGLGFKSAADLFGLRYYHPENFNDLNRACDEVKTIGESAVIEITGSRIQNIKEHEEIRINLGNELSI
jgi:2-succinyl-5-enolpyruvyl-6-hydroxy-3-cyclohexene-1-carboxylate synthase